MSFKKPTYEVQGMTFTLKPTTVNNRVVVSEMLQKAYQKVMDGVPEDINVDGFDLESLAQLFDEYAMYFDVFKILTEGPHEKLEYRDFDQKLGEQVMRDFFPGATVRTLELIGFINSSSESFQQASPMNQFGSLG